MLERVRDYYYLTKPGIIYGNLIHTFAASLLAAAAYGFDVLAMVGVAAGSSAVIASGCVVNNYIDRKIDAKMKRTKKRALVNGTISHKNALIFACLLALAGFWILAILTNQLVLLIGLIAYVFYIVIYGYAKRKSVHSTLIGSIPGALPPLAGYVAVSGTIDSSAWLIFFLIVSWQMVHFYAISLYRRSEYEAAGLPVLGVVSSSAVVKLNMAVFMIAYAVVLTTLNNIGAIGMAATFIMLIGTAYWAFVFTRPSPSIDAWAKRVFRVSLMLALLLLIASVVNVVLM